MSVKEGGPVPVRAEEVTNAPSCRMPCISVPLSTYVLPTDLCSSSTGSPPALHIPVHHGWALPLPEE